MSRTERFLAHHWRGVASLFAFVALFGIAAILWARIDSSDRRADQFAAEADLRGEAVSTLATDVRKLRTQLKAEGKTPVAPDPTVAVSDLPERAEVPVPIPGPKGDKGDKGDPGEPAPTMTPSPGPAGPSGQPGSDGADGQPGQPGPSGPPGPAGQDGQNGRNGTDGQDGEDGQPPAGWTWTDPQGVTYTCTPADGFDPEAPRYTCTASSEGSPEQEPDPGPQDPSALGMAALAPDRRRY